MEDAQAGRIHAAAAEVYDAFFVPALFDEWPPRLIAAAEIGEGMRVLDVACGTGVLARAVSERVPGTEVVGLDANEGMLAVARHRSPELEWRQGRAESLPFEAARFDRVVSQFGLMFFDDRVAALSEMRRVLRPGGRGAVAVWASLEETPGYAAMTRLLHRLFGERIAGALHAPYCLGDKGELRRLFGESGFEDFEVRTIRGGARFASIDEWVRMDVKGWTLGDLIDDDQYGTLRAEARSELAHFAGADGTVAFDAPAHIVVARA